jgi:hypothetical protein
MDLRSNPRAVAAARRIQAQTGFDVLDEDAVGQVIELCAARRARARRLAVLSGVLAVAVLVAFTAAIVLGRLSVYELILGPVLFLLNGMRFAAALAAMRRVDRIPRSIEAARAEVRAAADGQFGRWDQFSPWDQASRWNQPAPWDQPGPGETSGRDGAPWPPSDVARWN